MRPRALLPRPAPRLPLAASAAVLLALASPPAATGQETSAPDQSVARSPVLTLDQDRLFAESRFGQAVLARHQRDVDALLAENRRIEAALEAEESDLTERRATLPPAEFQMLAAAFDTKAEGIRTAQNAKDRALGQRLDEERQRFYRAVGPVLAQLLREAGAMAIIDKRAVILSFDAIDLTDVAVARLDATLGDGGDASAGQGNDAGGDAPAGQGGDAAPGPAPSGGGVAP